MYIYAIYCSSLQPCFSSESLVQSSVTYNRDKKQCTRTTILCMRLVESSLHAACQAFSTDACCCQYLVKRAYDLQTFSVCMPNLPPQQRGEPPCTSRQHPTRTAYTNTWPTDLPLARHISSVFHEALHLLFIEQRK